MTASAETFAWAAIWATERASSRKRVITSLNSSRSSSDSLGVGWVGWFGWCDMGRSEKAGSL